MPAEGQANSRAVKAFKLDVPACKQPPLYPPSSFAAYYLDVQNRRPDFISK